jgi:hypothetical protein
MLAPALRFDAPEEWEAIRYAGNVWPDRGRYLR